MFGLIDSHDFSARAARDFAIIGFTSPLGVLGVLVGSRLSAPWWLALAITCGVAGGALGWFIGRVVGRAREGHPVAGMLFGVFGGALWGAITAVVAGLVTAALHLPRAGFHVGDTIAFGVMFGAPAAALQLGWSWPAWCLLARRGGPTWLVPVVASVAFPLVPYVGSALDRLR